MCVYPFEFYQYINPFFVPFQVSVELRFTVCQSTSGLLFFYRMMSGTYTQISTIKLYSVQDICCIPQYQQYNLPRTTSLLFAILLTYFPYIVTVIDYIHIQIYLLTYLLMCFKCICMKRNRYYRLLHVVYAQKHMYTEYR